MQTNVNIQDIFVKNAEAVSAVIYNVKNLEEAVSQCLKICAQKEKNSIAVPDGKISEMFKCEYRIYSEDIYENRDNIDIGFTMADAGISDTGSIVINSTDENLRIATMLSDIHVAVINKSTIVEKASDLSESLKEKMADSANYTAFITGPSRTADIERVLAIGVHGPLELHIIILEDI